MTDTKMVKLVQTFTWEDQVQKHWKCTDGTYLLSSSVDESGKTSANETLLFRSNELGDITDFDELSGVRGTGNHQDVLELAGYKIEEGSNHDR